MIQMKEGRFNMNEVKRISIIESVVQKKRTQKEAAYALRISERQVRNIVKRFKEEGYEVILVNSNPATIMTIFDMFLPGVRPFGKSV